MHCYHNYFYIFLEDLCPKVMQMPSLDQLRLYLASQLQDVCPLKKRHVSVYVKVTSPFNGYVSLPNAVDFEVCLIL